VNAEVTCRASEFRDQRVTCSLQSQDNTMVVHTRGGLALQTGPG